MVFIKLNKHDKHISNLNIVMYDLSDNKQIRDKQAILNERFTDIINEWYKYDTKYYIDLYHDNKELVKKISERDITYFHGM